MLPPPLNLGYSIPLTHVSMTLGGTCFLKAPSFRIQLNVCVCVSAPIMIPTFVTAGNN